MCKQQQRWSPERPNTAPHLVHRPLSPRPPSRKQSLRARSARGPVNGLTSSHTSQTFPLPSHAYPNAAQLYPGGLYGFKGRIGLRSRVGAHSLTPKERPESDRCDQHKRSSEFGAATAGGCRLHPRNHLPRAHVEALLQRAGIETQDRMGRRITYHKLMEKFSQIDKILSNRLRLLNSQFGRLRQTCSHAVEALLEIQKELGVLLGPPARSLPDTLAAVVGSIVQVPELQEAAQSDAMTELLDRVEAVANAVGALSTPVWGEVHELSSLKHSYDELVRQHESMQNKLEAAGLRTSDIQALLVENRPEQHSNLPEIPLEAASQVYKQLIKRVQREELDKLAVVVISMKEKYETLRADVTAISTQNDNHMHVLRIALDKSDKCVSESTAVELRGHQTVYARACWILEDDDVATVLGAGTGSANQAARGIVSAPGDVVNHNTDSAKGAACVKTDGGENMREVKITDEAKAEQATKQAEQATKQAAAAVKAAERPDANRKTDADRKADIGRKMEADSDLDTVGGDKSVVDAEAVKDTEAKYNTKTKATEEIVTAAVEADTGQHEEHVVLRSNDGKEFEILVSEQALSQQQPEDSEKTENSATVSPDVCSDRAERALGEDIESKGAMDVEASIEAQAGTDAKARTDANANAADIAAKVDTAATPEELATGDPSMDHDTEGVFWEAMMSGSTVERSAKRMIIDNQGAQKPNTSEGFCPYSSSTAILPQCHLDT